MTAPFRRTPLRRPNMRRAVILFPSGLTLGNLFFGVFAIIAASRLEFTAAGVYVMLGGICDALDGRVARATNAGTEFGEELDSLVDAITFGLAPALIMYFAVLNRDGWDWVWVFLFAACAVLRLARFNIEQAGTAKTYFQGLPSPAAGITLASYYWFSQSDLYNYGAIADLKWHVLLRYLMVVLSFLMISNVPYPTFPRTGFRSLRSLGATLLVVGAVVLLATRRLEYFFPIALIYVAWGLARWVFSGLFERRQPTLPYDLSEGEDDEEDEEFELADSRVHATRQGHREPVTARPERPRGRLGRGEPEPSAPRAEQPARRPERPAAADRTVDAERAARREKKKDRPKRADRPDRPERTSRPDAAIAAVAASAAPAPESGPAAITLGQPPVEPAIELDDDGFAGDDTGEREPAGDVQVVGADGAPPRKRKRRRRRGERKERPAGDAPPVTDADSSPYASPASPTSASAAPVPSSVPVTPTSIPSPAPTVAPSPYVPPSIPEPSE